MCACSQARDAEDNAYIFISEICNCVVRLWLQKLAKAKYASVAFNSKGNYEKLTVVFPFLQTTWNLIISQFSTVV